MSPGAILIQLTNNKKGHVHSKTVIVTVFTNHMLYEWFQLIHGNKNVLWAHSATIYFGLELSQLDDFTEGSTKSLFLLW